MALRTLQTDVILQPANCYWYQKIRNKGRIEAYLPPCGWKSEGWSRGGGKWPEYLSVKYKLHTGYIKL